MLISALVNTGYHGDNYSVEVIVCFDTCLYCNSLRIKKPGNFIDTKKGKMHIHHVYCNCDPYITHDELDEEWSVIRECNNLGVVFNVDCIP